MKGRENIEEAAADIVSRRITEQEHSTSRGEFFTQIPGVAAVAPASAAVSVISPAEATEPQGSPGAANKRAAEYFQIRPDAAQEEAEVPVANYYKGLPHNAIGQVTPSAYQAFLDAVHQGIFS
jgi:hypothetical protein